MLQGKSSAGEALLTSEVWASVPCHKQGKKKSQGAHSPYFTFCSLSPFIRCYVTFNIFHLLLASMVWYC